MINNITNINTYSYNSKSLLVSDRKFTPTNNAKSLGFITISDKYKYILLNYLDDT
jgi:hypothetical protein